MELEALVGEHVLDAVEYSVKQVPDGYSDDGMENANCMVFRLNGTAYMVIEDPSDGYRSSMKDLTILPDAEMKNVFPPVRVLGVYRDKSDYNSADILEMYCIQNGKKVLEAGTENSDDYYPSFVANFNPENMPVNEQP